MLVNITVTILVSNEVQSLILYLIKSNKWNILKSDMSPFSGCISLSNIKSRSWLLSKIGRKICLLFAMRSCLVKEVMPPDPPSRLAPLALTYGASYFSLIPLLLVILRRTLISIEATITAPVTFKVWHLIFK